MVSVARYKSTRIPLWRDTSFGWKIVPAAVSPAKGRSARFKRCARCANDLSLQPWGLATSHSIAAAWFCEKLPRHKVSARCYGPGWLGWRSQNENDKGADWERKVTSLLLIVGCQLMAAARMHFIERNSARCCRSVCRAVRMWTRTARWHTRTFLKGNHQWKPDCRSTTKVISASSWSSPRSPCSRRQCSLKPTPLRIWAPWDETALAVTASPTA